MTGAIARAELNRGLAARDAGNYPAALKALQSVIQIDPGDPLGFLYLGDLHLRQGRYTLAVSTARTGLAMPCSSSNRSFGLQILALAFINLKKPRKAIAAGLDAIQNDPANASNHRVYAQTLWSAKKLKAAEAQFQHALQLNPQLLATLTTYARFLKGLGRLREARDVVERATLIEPDNIDVLLLRGQIAFKYDELETARDLALWVLSRQATNKKALELLAMVKSRRSWLTGPFWWFANFLSRYRKTAIVAIVVVVGTIGGLASSLLDGTAAAPSADGIGNALVWIVVLYPVICALHVSWLVRRDLRQVRLKRDF